MPMESRITGTALDEILRAVGDPLVTLSAIGPGHAEAEEAQLLRAAVGVIAKTPATFPAIAEAVRHLREASPSPRARAHIAATEAWLRGEPLLAAERYAAAAHVFPHDLLALRLALSSFFFVGSRARACEVVDETMQAWDAEDAGFEFVLAMASFVHAENRDAAQAETLGRRALARDPACPAGVHAVAHAIAESGRPRDGARWMREQRSHWATESHMRTHNAWHLAMFDVEAGDVESAYGILERCLLPASMRSPHAACDTTELLWRLQRDRHDDGCVRWRVLSDAFERTMTPGFWPYVDIHAGLAHALAGERSRLRSLIEKIEEVERGATSSDFSVWRAWRITKPYLRMLDALADGDHHGIADALTRLHPNLDALGGSSIQLAAVASIPRRASQQRLADPCRGPA